MKLFIVAILLNIFSYAISWVQLNGQFVWPWFDRHPILLGFGLGGFVGYIIIFVTKTYVNFFDGLLWPGRFLTFSIGIIVFAIFTYFLKGEGINLKTAVSLCLAITIIIIQVLWK